MLVLTRKEKETIVIGDNITVTVNRIAGGRVTLGVDAPTYIRIVRGELANLDKKRASAVESQADENT